MVCVLMLYLECIVKHWFHKMHFPVLSRTFTRWFVCLCCINTSLRPTSLILCMKSRDIFIPMLSQGSVAGYLNCGGCGGSFKMRLLQTLLACCCGKGSGKTKRFVCWSSIYITRRTSRTFDFFTYVIIPNLNFLINCPTLSHPTIDKRQSNFECTYW